jgi:hypothetical protein
MSTGIWSHGAGGTAIADWTSPGASGTVRFNNASSSDWFNGKVAVRAAWSNLLPYAADTGGDAAIEAAGLEDTLQAWVDVAPSALCPFNQDAVTTPVEDITGGGGDETSRTGTAVVTGDDPPGFDFTLGGPPPVLEEGPQHVIHRSNLRLG